MRIMDTQQESKKKSEKWESDKKGHGGASRLQKDGEQGDKFTRRCILDTVIDLFPERGAKIFAIVRFKRHGTTDDPVQKYKGSLIKAKINPF
jgi:hypothetical protein